MVMRFGEMLVFGGKFWNLKGNFVFCTYKITKQIVGKLASFLGNKHFFQPW